MGGNGRGRQAGEAAQFFEQRLQAGHLGWSWFFVIKIANQANADADLVQFFAGEMPALELMFPAVADEDLAVGHAVPVADDKVIGEAVFHPALAVKAVEGFGRADARAAVRDHDVFPIPMHRDGLELPNYDRVEFR